MTSPNPTSSEIDAFILAKVKEVVPEICKWQDGALVQFERYSHWTGEGSQDEFSNEPDNFSTGIIFGDRIHGDDLPVEELCEKDFVDGIWTDGVDENGGIDVWEYIKVTILGRPIQLAEIMRALRTTFIDIYISLDGDVFKGLEQMYEADPTEEYLFNWNLSLDWAHQEYATKLAIWKLIQS